MSALLSARVPPSLAADEQLATLVKRQLAADSRAVSRLAVEVENGVVTLRGIATSFYQKQLWLHGAKRVAGDDVQIDDQITVTSKWEATDFGWRD
jgi:osmotically-inducible protein OsmY